MNIAFLIFSFNIGGIERLLVDMCNTMICDQNNIFLIIINDDYNKDLLKKISPKVNIILLKRPIGSHKLLPYMIKFWHFIRRNHINIVHCHGINCVLFASMTKFMINSPKIINTVHDNGNYTRTYSKKKIALAHLFLDMTVAISDSVRNEIISQKINKKKVITIHNAIDTTRFCLPNSKNSDQNNNQNASQNINQSGNQNNSQNSNQIAAQNINKNDATSNKQKTATNTNHNNATNKYSYISRDNSFNRQTIRIVNVARFMPAKKGQDILVEASSILIKKYPLLQITFAGDVAKNQENAYKQILETIKEKKLEKNIIFAGNVDNIPKLLSESDIFVLPSRYEGFGIALIEALATGIPAIASNLEGPAEIMKDHPEYGLLFTPGDSTDLAYKIDQMIQNYDTYDPVKISTEIRKTYNIKTMCSHHLELYKKLLLK